MRYRFRALALGATAIAVALGAAPAMLPLAAPAQTSAATTSALPSEATVKALQEALNAQGVAVTIDGVLDEETRAAIRTFQSQHHLPVTGEPDKATLEKLGLSGATGGDASGPPSVGAAMGGPHMGRRGAMGMMGPRMEGPGMTMPETMHEMMAMHGMAGRGMNMHRMMQEMMAMHGMAGGGMAMPEIMHEMMAMHGMAGGGMNMHRMTHEGLHRHETMGAMMDRRAMGPAGAFGHRMVVVPIRHLSVEEVRHFLEHWLDDLGNKRIRLGDIKEVDDEHIAADIVTQDGSLVDRLRVDRHTGEVMRIEE